MLKKKQVDRCLDKALEERFADMDRRFLLMCIDYLEHQDVPYVFEALGETLSNFWEGYCQLN